MRWCSTGCTWNKKSRFTGKLVNLLLFYTHLETALTFLTEYVISQDCFCLRLQLDKFTAMAVGGSSCQTFVSKDLGSQQQGLGCSVKLELDNAVHRQ